MVLLVAIGGGIVRRDRLRGCLPRRNGGCIRLCNHIALPTAQWRRRSGISYQCRGDRGCWNRPAARSPPLTCCPPTEYHLFLVDVFHVVLHGHQLTCRREMHCLFTIFRSSWNFLPHAMATVRSSSAIRTASSCFFACASSPLIASHRLDCSRFASLRILSRMDTDSTNSRSRTVSRSVNVWFSVARATTLARSRSISSRTAAACA
mmetsp:Transcript_51996/g.145056  ORF Transcript_51996/g.145056 Transcript_51996/m.145056 type:complete len:206 (-) Transcript_51996:201-818(-)